MRKAFADKEILLRLTSLRTKRRQLLITNDRKLSRDAYNLNMIESCYGQQVLVYYLSANGNLCECDCPVRSQPEIQPAKVIVTKAPSYIEPEKKPQCNIVKNIGRVVAAVSIFAAGYGACKYGKTAITGIKNMFSL